MSGLTIQKRRYASLRLGDTVTLKAEIISYADLLPAERKLWRAWQKDAPQLASPFFRLEFAKLALANVPNSSLARLKRGAETVGYFAFQRRGGAIYPIAAPMSDYQGVVGPLHGAPSLEEVAVALGAARLCVNGWVGQSSQTRPATTCQAVMPAGGYEVWYTERRKSEPKYFKDKARCMRGLELEFGTVELKTGLKSQALLDQLIALKREQYMRTNKHDIFAVEWTRRLLSALLEYEGEGFGASIAALYAGGQLMALELSLHADDRYHFWFPAYLEIGARLSPGILLSMETMALESSRGFRVFDYGSVGEAYKKYFVNETQLVFEGSVVGGHAINRVAIGALSHVTKRRSEALRLSVQRRWAVIEATEVSRTGRLQGALIASRRLIRPFARGAS